MPKYALTESGRILKEDREIGSIDLTTGAISLPEEISEVARIHLKAQAFDLIFKNVQAVMSPPLFRPRKASRWSRSSRRRNLNSTATSSPPSIRRRHRRRTRGWETKLQPTWSGSDAITRTNTGNATRGERRT